jgi:hypothetical protein
VEHPCHRCGSAVEDSSPFCSACGSPQIRFSGREEINAGTGAGTSLPVYVRAEAGAIAPQSRIRSDKTAVLRSALIAGAIAAVLSALPFGFILALPLAGFLSVLFYRRGSGIDEPSPGAGFQLGALTGLFGFAIFVVLTAVETLIFHAQNELRDAMVEAVRHAQARNPDPQAKQMFDYFMTPQGLAVMMVVGMIFLGIVFVLLSGLGGAISAALLRQKRPRG